MFHLSHLQTYPRYQIDFEHPQWLHFICSPQCTDFTMNKISCFMITTGHVRTKVKCDCSPLIKSHRSHMFMYYLLCYLIDSLAQVSVNFILDEFLNVLQYQNNIINDILDETDVIALPVEARILTSLQQILFCSCAIVALIKTLPSL